jgi:molybdate transport system ATP-binding protein
MLSVEAATRIGDLDLDLSVEVRPGECLAVVGRSGAGKTSLLRIVAGLLSPARGRVLCGAAHWLDTERGVDVPAERRRCGYVFQEYALFPHMTAWENVAYGVAGVGRHERRRLAHDLLDRFDVGSRARARPRDLSGGERQRVALARALARRPDALLLDEPLAALDVRTRASAAARLAAALAELEAPTLLVAHDFADAARLADRIAVVERGRIVQAGTATELAASPSSAFVADFTGAVVLSGTATAGGSGLTHVELDGGGTLSSTDKADGRVGASVFPWEIAIEPDGARAHGSAQNRIDAEVVSVTAVGNRVRLGLAASQPLVAEITGAAAEQLALAPGARVTASWKAAATRLVPL